MAPDSLTPPEMLAATNTVWMCSQCGMVAPRVLLMVIPNRFTAEPAVTVYGLDLRCDDIGTQPLASVWSEEVPTEAAWHAWLDSHAGAPWLDAASAAHLRDAWDRHRRRIFRPGHEGTGVPPVDTAPECIPSRRAD